MIRAGADVNEAQPDGTRPVHWAVYRVDHDLLALLIEKKAKVDVTNLKLHDSLRVSDLATDEKVRILDAPERVIAHIAMPKAEEVVAVVAGAEAVVPAGAEPEVIKKGKKEEEGAEEPKGKADKAEKKEKK